MKKKQRETMPDKRSQKAKLAFPFENVKISVSLSDGQKKSKDIKKGLKCQEWCRRFFSGDKRSEGDFGATSKRWL